MKKAIENWKTLKHHTFLKQKLFFLLFTVSVAMKMKKHLKKKNQYVQKKYVQKKVTQEFRLKEIVETRIFFIEKIKQNKLNKKHKKIVEFQSILNTY